MLVGPVDFYQFAKRELHRSRYFLKCSINPNLFESCKGYCQNEPTVQHEDYLCNVIGADVLFNNYGLLRCGYTPEESAQGQIYEQVTETKNTSKIIAIVALVLIILSGLYYLIFKS